MELPFQIYIDGLDSVRSRELISRELEESRVSGVRLDLNRREEANRSPLADPTVLVALVAGTSAAISALITSLFRVVEATSKASQDIVVRGRDGTEIRFPADSTTDDIQRLAELAKSLSDPSVEIVLVDGSSGTRNSP
jgi:cell division septal protein FtsQ